MEFRWSALLAIWTIISGPIFSGAPGTVPLFDDHTTAQTRTLPLPPHSEADEDPVARDQ